MSFEPDDAWVAPVGGVWSGSNAFTHQGKAEGF